MNNENLKDNLEQLEENLQKLSPASLIYVAGYVEGLASKNDLLQVKPA
ncbi:MAG: hypothetical protein KH050_06020 [Clostridiaceae bacterium]|nr:hypothetical protein [Clostridiaceae bacterium]